MSEQLTLSQDEIKLLLGDKDITIALLVKANKKLSAELQEKNEKIAELEPKPQSREVKADEEMEVDQFGRDR